MWSGPHNAIDGIMADSLGLKVVYEFLNHLEDKIRVSLVCYRRVLVEGNIISTMNLYLGFSCSGARRSAEWVLLSA